MPGYIRTTARFLLSHCPDVTVNYNPAFVAQGAILEGYKSGGYFGLVLAGVETDECFAFLANLYAKFGAQSSSSMRVCRMSPESAELCKLASNCFRALKISFANMIGDIADKTPGADKYDICQALGSDDSIGPKCMTPGDSYGGPCYPRDNVALGVYANQCGVAALLPQASDAYNKLHSDGQYYALVGSGLQEVRCRMMLCRPYGF